MITETELTEAKNTIEQYYNEKYPKVTKVFIGWENKGINIDEFNNTFFSATYNKFLEFFGEDFLEFEVQIWSNDTGRNLIKDGEKFLNIAIKFGDSSLFGLRIGGNKAWKYKGEVFYDMGRFDIYINEAMLIIIESLRKWYQDYPNTVFPKEFVKKYDIKRKKYDINSVNFEDIEKTLNEYFDVRSIEEKISKGCREITFTDYNSHYKGLFENNLYIYENGNIEAMLHEINEDDFMPVEESIKELFKW